MAGAGITVQSIHGSSVASKSFSFGIVVVQEDVPAVDAHGVSGGLLLQWPTGGRHFQPDTGLCKRSDHFGQPHFDVAFCEVFPVGAP